MRYAIHHRGAALLRAVAALTGSNAAIIVTPPTWRVRISRSLVALVTLTLVYQAYALFVVPWIEPPPPAARKGDSGNPLSAVLLDPNITDLFPEGAWERKTPMVLTTPWGKLLFQEYEPFPDGRLELRPCTVVFYAPGREKNGEKQRRAVVLQTPDKAVLSFSGPLNLMQSEVTKLKGAMLEGDVRIFSPATSENANDALLIETRNIQILPRQIWTPHDVVFQYGSSRGSGRDLSITLVSDEDDSSASTDTALVQNLEMLELVHIDKLLLDIPGKGLLGDVMQHPHSTADASHRAVTTAPEEPASVAVEVTCQGPFQFDFRQGLATLQDHVDVVRLNPVGPSDQLNCQKLLIYFEMVTPTTFEGSPPQPEDAVDEPPAIGGPPAGEMRVKRVVAQGLPVTLRAPSVAAAARGEQLQYDFPTRQIMLQDRRQAWFSCRQHEIESPQLVYTLHEDAKRLGEFVAAGPGTFHGVFGKQADQHLDASWAGTLQLQPQDELHVLSAVEGAAITWQEMGHFAADTLFVWLAEVPVEDGVQPPADTTGDAVVVAGPELGPAVDAGPSLGIAEAPSSAPDEAGDSARQDAGQRACACRLEAIQRRHSAAGNLVRPSRV